ncbi:unnamed protein product [Litomosoides sigmodontis]|uniref:Uncharacterized protein n=1 Tax=Litomosoides sigmodontis TaxID=42156 RepID=A0A3P6SU38_LITSI|nr:unnamed protein product [Litomosoides sigmodontis]
MWRDVSSLQSTVISLIEEERSGRFALIMSSDSLTTTTRLRITEPVYTSDKRAKFTQRENKKWIRFCTVIGYVCFVSIPAASLSIYYIWIWDPDYISRFPSDRNRTLTSDHTAKPMSLSVRQGSRPKYKCHSICNNGTPQDQRLKIEPNQYDYSIQSQSQYRMNDASASLCNGLLL